jgi:hypothetical protein
MRGVGKKMNTIHEMTKGAKEKAMVSTQGIEC